jgi:hypothetical protein
VDKYLLINSLWNENDFNGLPKIAALLNHVLTIGQDLFSIKKIKNGDVKKNLWVSVGLNFLVLMSSPKSVVGIQSEKAWIPANNPRE